MSDITVNYNPDDNTIDEIIYGKDNWLHAEEMDRRDNGEQMWSVRVGTVTLNVTIPSEGPVISTIYDVENWGADGNV